MRLTTLVKILHFSFKLVAFVGWSDCTIPRIVQLSENVREKASLSKEADLFLVHLQEVF